MREKLVLIDGHSILNRAFYGVPELTNSEGLHTNAVYGFLNILFKILAEEQPQYLAVAFDLKAPTFRHKMYDAYKGTRKPQPPQLHEQVPVMKEVLTAMGVPLLMKEGYEADDLLGTVAKRMEKKGLDVSVVSGDRDLLQLATEHIMIRIPKTKRTGTEIEDYHAKEVLEKYQVTSCAFRHYNESVLFEDLWPPSCAARQRRTPYGKQKSPFLCHHGPLGRVVRDVVRIQPPR